MPAGASARRGREYDRLEAHENRKGAVQKMHQTRPAHYCPVATHADPLATHDVLFSCA